jgi:hypothetical protein
MRVCLHRQNEEKKLIGFCDEEPIFYKEILIAQIYMIIES